MTRRGANFVQSDLARTIRACEVAGVLSKVTIRVEAGAFVIEPLPDSKLRPPERADEPDDAAGDDIIL